MRLLRHNLVKLEKFDGSNYNTWRYNVLFMLELMGVDEALTHPYPIVDKGQLLRVVQIVEATKKIWTKVNSLC